MSSLLRLPDRRLEREQAADWIARLDRGLRGAEHEELSRWLEESDRNRDAFLEFARRWDRMDMVSEMAEQFPLREAVDVIDRRGIVAWPAMAAAVAVLFGVAVTLFHFREDNRFTGDYVTAIGEQRSVELPDHSKVQLNTNTSLHVEFSAATRLIKMTRGEANFEVAKNPARPFIVRVAGIDFTAVGTAFNVRADSPRDLRLTVSEGRVHVRPSLLSAANDGTSSGTSDMSAGIDVEVGANKGVVVDPTTERIEFLTQTQIAAASAWQQGMAIFDGTPLEQVVAEFGRYSTTRIMITDQELRRVPVSGYFRVGDIDALSATLKQNFDIDVQKNTDSIILKASRSK